MIGALQRIPKKVDGLLKRDSLKLFDCAGHSPWRGPIGAPFRRRGREEACWGLQTAAHVVSFRALFQLRTL
jgi:hypothetical protein